MTLQRPVVLHLLFSRPVSRLPRTLVAAKRIGNQHDERLRLVLRRIRRPYCRQRMGDRYLRYECDKRLGRSLMNKLSLRRSFAQRVARGEISDNRSAADAKELT
jgi:hypothetical protein